MRKTVPENMYANNVRMQKNIWRAIRISGRGGSSGSSRWREAVQHWLLSSPTSHHVLFAWNNAKKLLIFYWYHNKNIFNFCLKAKKLKYNLVPQWPREVFDWPANFQHFSLQDKMLHETWALECSWGNLTMKSKVRKTVTFAFAATFIWFQAFGLDRNISLAVAPLQ